MPCLLYACPINKRKIVKFTIIRALISVFCTKSIDVVQQCRSLILSHVLTNVGQSFLQNTELLRTVYASY